MTLRTEHVSSHSSLNTVKGKKLFPLNVRFTLSVSLATDLHAGHFGTAQLLLTYISHKVLQCMQGHSQSTLLSSLGLSSAARNIPVSSTRVVSAEASTLLVMRPVL